MGICIARLLIVLLLGSLAGAAQADRLRDYDNLRSQGKVEEGLALLRQELADPEFFLAGTNARGVALRQRLLMALGEYGGHKGVTPDLEAEARKHYDEGLGQFAGSDPELQAYMHEGMSRYFSWSFRNGLALPYSRKSLAYWEQADDLLHLFLAQDSLVKVYWDMGELELSFLNMQKALKTADRYFLFGKQPAEASQWAIYDEALLRYIGFAGQRRDIALLENLWSRRAPIGPSYFRIGADARFHAAENFLYAGESARAQTLMAEGVKMWAEEKPFWSANTSIGPLVVRGIERTQRCGDAALALHAKRYSEAVPSIDDCIRLWTETNLPFDIAMLNRARGRALEGAGRQADAAKDYRASIEYSEKVRASFTVGERVRFFRTVARDPYWGLVRILARQAREDESAFFDALNTAEQVRGRQLGELIDPEMSQRISPASFKALQQRLLEDQAVLAYTVTEDEIVLLGLTRDRRLAVVVPYDGAGFAALARGIAADLAKPSTAMATLEKRLLKMSGPVLSAARPLLAGKKRIIVLPDGVMNLVPFELLSAAEDSYRPLVADYVISASPSLVFIQHAQRAHRTEVSPRLFAVADPKHNKPSTLAGTPVEEVQLAARGSRFLSYFDPLPETRTEAEAISKLFAGRGLVLAGEQAVESQLKSRDLTPYDYLHFATHGILGGEVPGVDEPALVLGEEPNEDGFLTASEVSKLRISAELTVLSACNTGSGEYVIGEGVMGISRAFLRAGSRAVVVSLWPVASMQTERLMVDFYRRLMGGQSAAEALRAAKLEMVEQARKTGSIEAHPFFWAPFIILGG